MEFNLEINGKYIVKSGLPFYYESQSFNNDNYFANSKFYDKTIVYIRDIITLSPFFTKIFFQIHRRNLPNRPLFLDHDATDRHERFSLPHFVVYDDALLEIPDEIHKLISSINGDKLQTFIKYSKFIENIIFYDPVLNDRISHAERMITNAENVKARQLQKIDLIYSEFIHEKKAFNNYDERLKNLFADEQLFGELNVIQEKLNTNLPNESDGSLREE